MRLILLMPFKQPFLTNTMVYLKAILVLNLPVLYKIRLDRNSTPVGRPPRKVPLAIEECIKRELEGMVKIGAITPVSEPTEWVSQMVAARKKDCSIPICIDPQDLNKALRNPQHPMRSVEDVASRLPNTTVFSTLDTRSGFRQIKLDYESSLFTTFSTSFGRYRFLLMPFGITAASIGSFPARNGRAVCWVSLCYRRG